MIPDKQPPQRSDRRRQKTRSAIMTAGERLFAARAMDSVTIDDIVAEADVAKGSFYNHFDDKQGLVTAIVELVQGDCEFHIYAANRGIDDPAKRMVRALCVVMRYAHAHPDRLQALISLSERRTIASTPLNAGVATDIGDGLARGVFADITVEAGVLIVLGIIRTAVAHVMMETAGTIPTELTTMVGAALLRALGMPLDEAGRLSRSAVRELLGEGAAA